MKPHLSIFISLSLSLSLGAIASGSFAQTWPDNIPVDTLPSDTLPSDTLPSDTLPSDRTEPVLREPGIPVETLPRFTCETEQGYPTVMYHPVSQPSQAYAWATPIELGGGWTPERRCAEISRRLEFYRPDGLLELQTGIENGYDTVCATTTADPRCRIVLTVPPGEDPAFIRDRVFQNLAIADRGQTTQPVTTFAEGRSRNWLDLLGQVSNLDLSSINGELNRRSPASRPQTLPYSGINLRPFLDPADGGTGQQLH